LQMTIFTLICSEYLIPSLRFRGIALDQDSRHPRKKLLKHNLQNFQF
jgi:hypothetical protein